MLRAVLSDPATIDDDDDDSRTTPRMRIPRILRLAVVNRLPFFAWHCIS
jgi:hypothetical protein